MGGAPLNVEYATTGVGILKIVTVLIGIIVTVLLFFGEGEANNFHPNMGTMDKHMKDGDCTTMQKGKKSPCPRKWMIIVPEWICLVACIISAICLIVLLIVKLENDIVKLLDFIYHIVFGVLIILAGIFALCYASIAYGLNDCEGNTNEKCSEVIDNAHRPNFFLPASLFAIINGIDYIIVGIMVKSG